MNIVVTGAAGMIGSNIIRGLNNRGYEDIIAVDNLERSPKFRNLVDLDIANYFDKREFCSLLESGVLNGKVKAIIHQGACSDTMEQDGLYMMNNNFRYSMALLDWSQRHHIPFIYASSAATYGGSDCFVEEKKNERPLNIYGYSKLLFDNVVRRKISEGAQAPIVGLRYFNVYGPRESHKGRMASVAYHHFNQFKTDGVVKLFEGSHGFPDGEQLRDFVFVNDVVDVNLFFLENPNQSGVFNLGTGRAQSFNDVALASVNAAISAKGGEPRTLDALLSDGMIQYISFPEQLKGKYQAFTQADISKLRLAGYKKDMATVEMGIAEYHKWLISQ
jgi:ADP-L-glycero-D-manno-heptose 6-epimerase